MRATRAQHTHTITRINVRTPHSPPHFLALSCAYAMALTSSGSAPPMAPACPPSLLLGPAAAVPNLQRTHDGRMDGACA
ncbi:hypothetical protein CLOM_g17233 [Closterium sp. NIES-68]|nr:hypothetical protein CLOM_g17233 [Closterium sp. NIES-68]